MLVYFTELDYSKHLDAKVVEISVRIDKNFAQLDD
jgi:hypothetical protein